MGGGCTPCRRPPPARMAPGGAGRLIAMLTSHAAPTHAFWAVGAPRRCRAPLRAQALLALSGEPRNIGRSVSVAAFWTASLKATSKVISGRWREMAHRTFPPDRR